MIKLVEEVKKPDEPGWYMTRVENLSLQELQLFVNFMEAHGFPVKLPDDPKTALEKSLMLAEVHFALVNGDPIVSPLAHHKDNFGGVCVEVNTMLVYFCHTAECGGLYYWTGDEDPAVSRQPPELLSTVPPDGCMRVVLLNGNTWHLSQYVEGHGVRGVLVLQGPTPTIANEVALAYAAVAGNSGPSARARELFGMPLLSSVLDEFSARVLSGLILSAAGSV